MEFVLLVLLYLVPAFLVLAFTIMIADPLEETDLGMIKMLFFISIIPLVNILASFSLGYVLFPKLKRK